MQQDPYAAFSRPVNAPAAQSDPYAGIAAPAAPAPTRPRPSPRSRPQAAPQGRPLAAAAPAPLAQAAPLNDLGITASEERDALIYQGYTPEQADAFMAESDPGMAPAQPASPLDDLNIHRPDYVDANAAAALNRPGTYTGPGSSEDNPFVLRENDDSPEYRDALQSLTRGMYIQTPEGVRRLSGDPYINQNPDRNDARVGNAVVREENLADQSRAFAMATAEQIPFLDEAAVGAAGLISGRGYSDVRDSYRAVQAIDNQANRSQRIAGGLTGAGLMLAAPGVGASGTFVRAGAGGLGQTARAAAVGGAGGALFGAANTDGGFEDRVQGGLLGAAVGAATGGLLDAGGQRAVQVAERRLSNPSPQRRLSREGVQLTPGQMLEPTPVIGPMLRGFEDGMTGVPVAGAVVQGARNRGVESFNTAALNRALAPIGETLPRTVKPGYEAVEEVQNRLGRAYEAILPGINANLDQPLYDDIARVLADASAEMPEDRLAQLGRVLQNRVFRNVEESNGAISGEQFKRIESELGALARQYRTANDPSAVSFGEAIVGIQNALRDMIGRQNPLEANRLRQINEGYANLVRLERAAGSTAAQATEGVFSPTQLGVAAAQGSSRSARANEGALLQDLAVAGRNVLPSRIGDSGTATRGAITGLLAGGAAFVNPVVAIPTIAATIGAYSKPAQDALNIIYRATDRRSATTALGELQRLASQNPALQSHYEAAARHLRDAFGNQAQGQEPRASGLLSPTSR